MVRCLWRKGKFGMIARPNGRPCEGQRLQSVTFCSKRAVLVHVTCSASLSRATNKKGSEPWPCLSCEMREDNHRLSAKET
jgi:hypothetical protein